MRRVFWIAMFAGSFSLMTTRLAAQLFFVGVRAGAGIPAGTFAEAGASSDGVLRGAKPGLGYGLDAGVGLGPVGLYAGTDRIQFDCRPESCAASGKYKLTGVSVGLRMGIPLVPIVKPWVKAGIAINELKGTISGASGGTTVTTERRPGYELGAGVDVPVLQFFSITPQVRYVSQKLRYSLPGTSGGSRGVQYYTFDLGFRFRSPI